jgi:type I restriction enzyme S subunit
MSWKRGKISNFTDVITGGTPSTTKKEYWENGNIPWLNSGELNQEIITTCDNYITEIGLQNSSSKLMPKDTVLIALTGTTTGVVGYLTFEACANQSVTGILPSKNHHPKFLYYFLKSIREQVLNESYGGAQKHISQGYVKDLEIPLPPLSTQKRIAEILDAADALRRKDQELLKKYDELAQAIFIDMFGDPVKNEKGWKIDKLGNCFKTPVKCGPFGSALKKEEYVKSGIPVLIMDNIVDYEFSLSKCLFITQSKFEELKSYQVNNGDIIISRAGTVGKMCVVEGLEINSIISTNLIKISLDENKINPYYFVFLMKVFARKIGRLRTGSENGFTHMNTGVLEGLEFPIPEIEIQIRFIETIKKIRILKLHSKSSDLNLFNTLIQKSFKGELVA